jgi:hypothetical protein
MKTQPIHPFHWSILAMLFVLTAATLHALDVPDAEASADFVYGEIPIDAEQGNLGASDFNKLEGRKTLTFEDTVKFPPTYDTQEPIASIVIPKAAKDGSEQVIRFHAPNKNWWLVWNNPYTVSYAVYSGKQSLIVRGLPATPGDLYITFSQPVRYVAFVLCNILNETGDKILFFKDEDGMDLAEEVEIKGGVKLTERGVQHGPKIFVGVKSQEGIRRIGFSFKNVNGESVNMARFLDDLGFKIDP